MYDVKYSNWMIKNLLVIPNFSSIKNFFTTLDQIVKMADHEKDPELATLNEEPLDEDKELEAMKQRVKEMEEEAAKLREMQAQVEKEMNMSLDSCKS